MRRDEGPRAVPLATDDQIVIEATATYANFRRFAVRVDEKLLGAIRR